MTPAIEQPHPNAPAEDLHAALTYISKLKEQLEADLAAGRSRRTTATALSLHDICELYFSHNPRKVSEATITRDRVSANNLCRLILADLRPDEIDEPAVIQYRNTREQEGARPRTILDEMSFLKMVLQFGMAWRRVTGMRTISFVTVPDVGEWDHPGVALSIDEFCAALEVLSPINRRRFIFGVTTMLRSHSPLRPSRRVDRSRNQVVVGSAGIHEEGPVSSPFTAACAAERMGARSGARLDREAGGPGLAEPPHEQTDDMDRPHLH